MQINDRDEDRMLREILAELREQTKLIRKIVAKVQCPCNPGNDTPVGFEDTPRPTPRFDSHSQDDKDAGCKDVGIGADYLRSLERQVKIDKSVR